MCEKRTEYCNNCKKRTIHKEVKGLERNDNGVITKYYKCENCDIDYTHIYITNVLNYCPECGDFTIQTAEITKEVEWTDFKFICKCGYFEREKELHPLESIESIIIKSLLKR